MNQTNSRPTDAELVRAAQGGSREAFAELVHGYEPLISSIAYALTGSLSESEDIAQATFATAWRDIGALRHPERFKAWVCIIARNSCHHWRRLRRTEATLSAARQSAVASPEPSPLDRIVRLQEERALWEALSAIPDTYRLPLVLFYREGQSVRNVAHALDLSEKSVKTRLSRARKMLQQRLAFAEEALSKVQPRRGLAAAIVAALPAFGSESTAHAEMTGAPRPGSALKVGVAVATVAILGAGGYTLVARPGSPKREGEQVATSGESVGTRPGGAGRPFLPQANAGSGEGAEMPAGKRSSVIFGYDFEDGVLPPLFMFGHVSPGPAGSPSRFCIVGTISPSWPISYIVQINSEDTPLFVYDGSTVVSFDYWVGDDTYLTEAQARHRIALVLPPAAQLEGDYSAGLLNIGVSVREHSTGRKHSFGLDEYVPEKWGHLEVPLARLKPAPGAQRLQAGTPIDRVGFLGGVSGGKPFYVDNIKLTASAAR